MLNKNTDVPVFRDYTEMLKKERPEAVVIATPSRLHADMVNQAFDMGAHVFCEKPFCLNWQDSEALSARATAEGKVAQVGYHYRYVGAFQEVKRLIDAGAIGRITHVMAEAYGPVVLQAKRQTWRSQKSEGGGCLYDYAAHPLNLLNWYFGVPESVNGSVMGAIFSEGIDDEVYSTLHWANGLTGQLSVNWSDESHRKMSTKISLIGTNGRIQADRQECQVYLRAPVDGLDGYGKGWTVKYTTELTQDRWFYLRGEEYSAQLDDFITSVAMGKNTAPGNDFPSATQTDKTMAMIIENVETGQTVGDASTPQKPARNRWFRR
jgi:predicted dehydrogenase